MEFRLQAEFIELDNLLKAERLVAHGAEARECILAQAVTVNGTIETRIRRKLRAGDLVEFDGKKITIVAAG